MAEKDWIARYFAPLAKTAGAGGLTDDVAELSAEGVTVATVDTLVEGVHFLPTDPIDTVARKLVRVNVSDLIAKGARPAEALLSLVWPHSRDEAQLAVFAEALGAELGAWGAVLVGGDTVTHDGGLILLLTLTGKCAAPPVRRSGAQPGDALYVSGVIGGGGVGLAAAVAGKSGIETDTYRVPPIPPLELADWIGTHAHAAMDISDGLLADAAQLLAVSGLGADLHLEAVPLFRPTALLDKCLVQVTAGDDYQCLIAAPATLKEAAPIPLTCIGHVTPGPENRLFWQGNPVAWPAKSGFEHR